MPRSASALSPTVGGTPARPLTTGRSGRVSFRDEMFYVHIIPPFSAPAFLTHGSSRTQLPTTFSLARSGTAVSQSGAHCGCRNLLPRGSRILPSLSPAKPRFSYSQRRAGSVCQSEGLVNGSLINEADRVPHVFLSFSLCRMFDSARAVGSSPPPLAADCNSQKLVQPSAAGEQQKRFPRCVRLFVSLASPKILSLGKMQASLLLPSLMRIFA